MNRTMRVRRAADRLVGDVQRERDRRVTLWRRNGFVIGDGQVDGHHITVLWCALCEQPVTALATPVSPAALRMAHHGGRGGGYGGLEGRASLGGGVHRGVDHARDRCRTLSFAHPTYGPRFRVSEGEK